jgi:hypothetical protein
VARLVEAGHDLAPVLVEVEGSVTGLELGQVALPGGRDPWPGQKEAEEHSLPWTSLPVAHERAHEDETRNELRPLGGGEHRGAGAHRVGHDRGGAAQ